MGVYICIGKPIHTFVPSDAKPFEMFGSFAGIQNYLLENDYVFIFLANGQHKIKKKAEQIACEKAIGLIK